MSKFILEEDGQASIEYILMVGGIIVAALVVGSIYSKAVRNAGQTIARSVDSITNATRDRVMELLNIS